MIVNIVIPVFNRLNETKLIIEKIREQITDNKLKIFIVNDGSSDGTAEWLKKQPDINVINGTGFLYWGGSINLAIENILKKGKNDEWLLFLNNDVTIESNYIESLLTIAKEFYPAAIGSIVRNKKTKKLISIGPKLLPWSLIVDDLKNNEFYFKGEKIIRNVDALSGRGVLYPIQSIKDSKGLRPRLIPHYFADYDLSLRVKKKGYELIISYESIVFTNEDFDLVREKRQQESLFFKLFSIKSSSLFYSKFLFWWEASTNIQKVSLLLRIILFIIKPGLRKIF